MNYYNKDIIQFDNVSINNDTIHQVNDICNYNRFLLKNQENAIENLQIVLSKLDKDNLNEYRTQLKALIEITINNLDVRGFYEKNRY